MIEYLEQVGNKETIAALSTDTLPTTAQNGQALAPGSMAFIYDAADTGGTNPTYKVYTMGMWRLL